MDVAIKDELEKLFFTGTEEDIRQFIKEKWEFLPQDVKDRISIAIMVDGIRGHVQDIQDVQSFKSACIEVLKALSEEEQAAPSTV